ncbi:aromatic ring-hydroxylating dioxygenase subunit alpha [Sphingopyxis sp. GC21]|uniref:aromatic ring-hydroxylating dioxygenase subunit alpha n=1 Tax=Sphingopyxis sp. GC21 TaxID=2933562 RepID=UPI0021E36DA3|nr:aromatic ring-hydroxylating dioxygenase subunit alpha [Sphingopyxis sp. GC21]
MFIRNAWYASAWGHELTDNGMLPRKILGTSLLFFRKSDGEVKVLRDRCSHRFAPLSLGRREGDCVRCMYHGLVFDGDGKCVEEPGRKGVSPNTDVPSYPAVERHKLVWVWMGDADKADPDLIPDCHQHESPEWASIPRTAHFKANYLLVLDNLLDFSHLSYVHENSLGGSKTIAETRPKVEQTNKGVKLTRWYLGEPGFAPYLKGYERFTGPVDRWNIYDLSTRSNHFSMSSGSAPANTGAPEGKLAPETMVFHSNQLITPEDENNTHYFWTYAHNFALENSELTQALAERISAGFQEDRDMIEAQQLVVNESGDDKMAFILADNGLTLGRRLIEAELAAEAAEQGR